MIRAVKLFISQGREERLMIMEAFLQLGFAKVMTWRRFSNIASKLGEPMQETSNENNAAVRALLRKVSTAIAIASRYTPWKSTCMVRAIAAMRMLEKRQIESTLYLGTTRDENKSLIAHAWLRSGSLYISGAEEMERFTIVQTFAKKIVR